MKNETFFLIDKKRDKKCSIDTETPVNFRGTLRNQQYFDYLLSMYIF